MPSENNTRRGVAAVLFLQSSMYTMDAMSTLNSSPWTAENVGANPDKAASCREYVHHALGNALGVNILASIIAESIWPMLGFLVEGLYLYWIYNRAIKRAIDSNSTEMKVD